MIWQDETALRLFCGAATRWDFLHPRYITKAASSSNDRRRCVETCVSFSEFAVSQTVVSAVVSEGGELCETVHH